MQQYVLNVFILSWIILILGLADLVRLHKYNIARFAVVIQYEMNALVHSQIAAIDDDILIDQIAVDKLTQLKVQQHLVEA